MTAKKPVQFDALHPVAKAVEPLRAEAVKRATDYAAEMVTELKNQLLAVGWDADQYAPYPKAWGMSTFNYNEALRKYQFVSRLTETTLGRCRRSGDPNPVRLNTKAIIRFYEETAENASWQYDAFIMKMIEKIGECESAELRGTHVWGYSYLTVTKATGQEVWKTQQIVNVSKLGLPFNQWPSRKMK